MEIFKYTTEAEMASKVSQLVVEEVQQNPDLLVCIAAGGSPTSSYKALVKRKSEFSCEHLRILKLDEWWKVPMDHPGTCENYVQQHIINPLGIENNRYVGFDSNAENPDDEIDRIQTFLDNNGPIDVCFLGLGMNGHIALNEPSKELQPFCHIANLSNKSQQHDMLANMDTRPTNGLTLGVANILQSKLIVMIINLKDKKEIAEAFLSGKITTDVPATLLWLHPNVKCFLCEE
jgi:galactosamine-6-phosphate isomerase